MRNIFVLVFIALIVAVSGCIGQNGLPLIINKNQSVQTYDIFINSIPSYGDPSYENTVKEAFLYWKVRENVNFNVVSNISKADVAVDWIKDFGGERAGHIVRGDFIQIGLGDSNCLGKWQIYTYDTVESIATHELGHAIGKEHSSEINDVMYPLTITKYAKDFDESEFLPQGAIRFYPFCSKKNSTTTYDIEVTSDSGINVYVVPSKDDFDAIGDRKEFSHYKDCARADTTFSKITCTIQPGSGIVLENPQKLINGVDARFTIKAVER